MDALGIVSLAGMGATGAALVALRLRDRSPAVRAFAVGVLAPWNALTFALRRRRLARRRPFAVTNEPKESLFAHLSADEAARAWALEGALQRLESEPERLVPHAQVAELRAMDVGSKDFRYAFALARWVEHVGQRPVHLVGVEIDGAGVYRSGHTRADRADAYCRQAGLRVRFEVADFLAFDSPPVHVLTAFFPFVLPYQLAAWGLPLAHFAPERFAARYRELLVPGGLLVVANHTAEESARTRELLAEGFVHVRSVPMRTTLVTYADETDERTLHLFVRV
jgi:SAM-dependent methyltransferase